MTPENTAPILITALQPFVPSDKIILDLCGGTEAWSEPYRKAGYDVRVITLPEYNILKVKFNDLQVIFEGGKAGYMSIPQNSIYGILSAPPCTMFSYARTNAKRERDLREGMECVRACLNIIWKCMEVKQNTGKKTLPLQFWALENPYYGFLKMFLGKPAMIFDPWEFGDGYQKKTALWGYFNEPIKTPVKMTDKMKKLAKTNSYLHTKFDYLKSKDIHSEKFGELDRQARRAITPAGFAEAFYKANQ